MTTSKKTDALTVALQMQEAVGYLAAVASRSELEKISHKLLGVHYDLGTKIAALTEKKRQVKAMSERENVKKSGNKDFQH